MSLRQFFSPDRDGLKCYLEVPKSILPGKKPLSYNLAMLFWESFKKENQTDYPFEFQTISMLT